MTYVIYTLAGISIVLAIGGISAYSATKHLSLILSSVVSILFSLAAIVLTSFWPLVIGFSLNVAIKLLIGDPSKK